MPAKLECPICLCSIKNKKTNFIATSCGHCFHASCLMTHLSMNGFSCPYCRNIMAEEHEQEEEEDNGMYEVRPFNWADYQPNPQPEPVIEPIRPEPEPVIEPIRPEPEPVIEPIRPEPEPVVEPTVVKRKIIEGKRYLMDKYNNLYDYDAYVRDGTDVVVGLWDPVQDRVVEPLIDV